MLNLVRIQLNKNLLQHLQFSPVFNTYVNLLQKQIGRYNNNYHSISAVDVVSTIHKNVLVLNRIRNLNYRTMAQKNKILHFSEPCNKIPSDQLLMRFSLVKFNCASNSLFCIHDLQGSVKDLKNIKNGLFNEK